MKKIFYITLAIAVMLSLKLNAQNVNSQDSISKFQFRVTAGLNIGGLTPIPLPNNIRKVKSYNPGLNPSIGLEGLYKFHKKWSVGINPRVEYKGMKVKDSVLYFHTMIQQGEGPEAASFEGDFTGTNYTEAKNLYLGVPVFIQFTPGKKWHYRLGGYFAFLLKPEFQGSVSDGYIRNGGSKGEKVIISSATFDFADKIKKFDYGIYAGINRDICERFSLDLSLQWGLGSAFPSSFTGISFSMHNVFAQIGGGYRF